MVVAASAVDGGGGVTPPASVCSVGLMQVKIHPHACCAGFASSMTVMTMHLREYHGLLLRRQDRKGRR